MHDRRTPPRLNPTAELQPFVARFMDVSLEVPDAQWLVQRVSPPGGATLSMRWSGEVALLDADPAIVPPRLSLTGPITHGGITGCAGALRMFVVFFTAAGAHDLFGLAMPPLVNRSVPAEELLGAWVGTLAEHVQGAATPAERRDLVEAALLRVAHQRAARPGLASRAANRVLASSGIGGVADVSTTLGVGERTLRRRFLIEVGVPLKAYARWARFTAAHAYLHATPRATWAAIAHRFGYADQSHLVREFRHFAGQPPSHLQEAERIYDPILLPDLGGPPRWSRRGRFLQDSASGRR